MRGQRLDARASPHVPQLDVLVERARHEHVRLRVEVRAEHVACVPLERQQVLAHGHVPNLDSLVVGGARKVARVARPHDVRDPLLVPGERLLRLLVGLFELEQGLLGGGRSSVN